MRPRTSLLTGLIILFSYFASSPAEAAQPTDASRIMGTWVNTKAQGLMAQVIISGALSGSVFIYALAAGVLLRHRTFLPSRFETLAHYYLMALFAFSFTRLAMMRPLFYTPFVLVAVTAIGVRIAVAIRSRKEHVLGATADGML